MSDQALPIHLKCAVRVGMDWGDKKHAWALQAESSSKIEKGEIAHTPEAIQEWVGELLRRFPTGCVAIALEQSRGPLVYALSKYPRLVLYPIHPTSAAEYRKVFRPSGAKSDGVDATLHLDMLIRHPDKLRPFNPDTPETRAIQLLTEDRRQLVDERTRLSNRLGADLKSYFPQLLQWFEDPYSPVVLDLLERWPSLEELQRAKPATLRKFFREHRCRDEAKNEERLENIRKAVALTTDFAVTTAGRAAASAAVRLLRELGRSIREYDRQIEELTVAHSDYLIFASLPGAGQVLIPRLIAGFGTRRDRYQNAAELQQFSGIAPVTEASGQQCWVHWRWCCPKFLRQTFHEWAAQTIQHCDWAAAYYRAQRDDKKKSHHAAVRSLAYKWIRIVFRCWKDRIPYDDAKYEATLKSRAKTTPVAKPTSAFELPIRWTSCGSFQKVALKNA